MSAPTNRRDVLYAFAIGFLAIAVYIPSLGTGFLADDYMILARLRDAGGLAHPATYFRQSFFDYYRPLAFLSHAVDWQLWHANAVAFHVTSVVLHAVNAALVFLLGSRFVSRAGGVFAAVLFATHPAAHEAVYWVAARFDLLATGFTLLALLVWMSDHAVGRGAGAVAFLMALLSKESALVLPVLTVAFDVLVLRLDVRRVCRRLVPLAIAFGVYLTLRLQAADLTAVGDARGHAKALVLVALLAGLLVFAAWNAGRFALSRRAADTWFRRGVPLAFVAAVLAAVVALTWAPTSGWVRQKLGFIAFSTFYLVSPVIFPAPPPDFFVPARMVDALPGLAALVGIAVLTWWLHPWWTTRPAARLFAVMLPVTLVPVSSLTGSSRYVYTAMAAGALLAAAAWAEARGVRRALANAVAIGFLVVSLQQLSVAAASWRWAGDMVRDGLTVMAASLEPCGTRDLLLLTAPVGIRGVYTHFYWDAFSVVGCAPRNVQVLLRLERTDASVVVVRPAADTIEIRIANYRGNAVTSRDLTHFDVPVRVGESLELESPIGRLRTYAAGTDQVFRLDAPTTLLTGSVFYFGNGRIQAVR